MRYNHKKLVILATGERLPEPSVEILAITLPAMALLKANQRDFLVLEDLYAHERVYEHTDKFAQDVKSWLCKADRLCLAHLGVNRSFSSLGFWILHRLSDLRYVHNIIDILEARYFDIELWTTDLVPDPPYADVNFDTINMSYIFGSGLGHVLIWMAAGSSLIKVCKKNHKKKGKLARIIGDASIKSLIRRAPEIVTRRAKLSSIQLKNLVSKKKCLLWVAQKGYDIDILKNTYREFDFLDIEQSETQLARSLVAEKSPELEQALENLCYQFFLKNLPRYRVWLAQLFRSYRQNIVYKIKPYEKSLEQRIRNGNPSALLYSIGAQNPQQEVLCRVANRLDIPVFFFKHGGIAETFLPPSILDPYLEHNPHLKRTQFLHSRVEQKRYTNLTNIRTILSGPLSKPKDCRSRQASKKKILYSVGPPTHYSFKEMKKNISDCQRFTLMYDLIEICAENNLNLSMKVHPVEWQIACDCLEILIDQCVQHTSKPKILVGGAIERILDGYDLLVFDMISSRVVSMALRTEIPIIIFLPEGNLVNEDCFADLKSRTYIVRNRQELMELLDIFRENGLHSKLEDEFAEKYFTYPDVNKAISVVHAHVLQGDKW